MLENVDLSYQILQHLGKDETPFPANLKIEDIVELFPEYKEQEVLYSLYCCSDAGLLFSDEIKCFPNQMKRGSKLPFVGGLIYGLSAKGCELYRNCKNYYSEAVEFLEEDDPNEPITLSSIHYMAEILIKKAHKKGTLWSKIYKKDMNIIIPDKLIQEHFFELMDEEDRIAFA